MAVEEFSYWRFTCDGCGELAAVAVVKSGRPTAPQVLKVSCSTCFEKEDPTEAAPGDHHAE